MLVRHWISLGISPSIDVDILPASHTFLGVTPGQHHPVLVENNTEPTLCWPRRGKSQGSHSPDLGREVRDAPRWRSALGSLSYTGTRCLHLGLILESSTLPKDWGPLTAHTKRPSPWRCIRITWPAVSTPHLPELCLHRLWSSGSGVTPGNLYF